MGKLANSMPLASVHGLVDETVAVETHMQEPLVVKPASKRKRLGFQALALMTDLELALMRLQQLDQSADTVFQDHPPIEEQEVERLTAALHALVEQHDEAGRSVTVYITEVGLTALFPLAAARLDADYTAHSATTTSTTPMAAIGHTRSGTGSTHSNGTDDDLDTRTSTICDHFARMTTMHQLVAMSLQLKDALRLSNHKYVAHQLALFYHCLGQAGSHFDKYRSRVELEFAAVKRACSETGTLQQLDSLTSGSNSNSSSSTTADNPNPYGVPRLPQPLVQWVTELADDVATEVLFRREVLRYASRTLAGFVHAVSS